MSPDPAIWSGRGRPFLLTANHVSLAALRFLKLKGVGVGRNRQSKKTDCGTVILHWLLVAALLVALATGLRIGSETPDRVWINFFNPILPQAAVWTEHMQSAAALVAISVAYIIYVRLLRLRRRILLDKVRLRGLVGRSYARWGAINVFLYWIFFLMLLLQLTTGALLFFGRANSLLVQMHWLGMWSILGYVVLHLISQWRLGGAAQLLRILRPTFRVPAAQKFEFADMLALLEQQSPGLVVTHTSDFADAMVGTGASAGYTDAAGGIRALHRDSAAAAAAGIRPPPSGHSGNRPRSPRKPGPAQLTALIGACAAAGLIVVAMLTAQRQLIVTLYIHRIASDDAPIIDGEASDPVWQRISPVYVLTENGGNFQGTGETTVSIRAAHDGVYAYFLFEWDDPTRSLKQLPMQKSAGVWHLLHDGYEIGDEHAYNEDKFSVLLSGLDAILAGDTTFHAGAAPLPDEPPTLSGRGLHYATQAGMIADVWEWKATSTNPSGYCDDDYFGPPAKGTSAQFHGVVPYHGGFAPDPGAANYQNNFTLAEAGNYAAGVPPRRLPKDLAVMNAALGRIDLDPDHGEGDAARWYVTDDNSLPYSPERDRLIPDGTVVPGVIISGQYSGDRADVRCAARWAAGRWALEIVRRLQTGSRYDVPIKTGIFMRVAAFDHAQIRHTRQVRPIYLEVE